MEKSINTKRTESVKEILTQLENERKEQIGNREPGDNVDRRIIQMVKERAIYTVIPTNLLTEKAQNLSHAKESADYIVFHNNYAVIMPVHTMLNGIPTIVQARKLMEGLIRRDFLEKDQILSTEIKHTV